MFKKIVSTAVLGTALSGCGAFAKQPSLDDIVEEVNINHSGNFECGASRVALTPYKHSLIAGIGPLNRFSEGTLYDKKRDETHNCYSRAVVFYNGGEIAKNKFYLAYVSVDILVITDKLREMVEERIPLSVEPVLCTTHPHSSIGGYWYGFLPELCLGSYAHENLVYLADKIAESINDAKDNVRPAKIGFARTQVRGVLGNRRDADGPVDINLDLIHVESKDGRNLADLFWFAGHPINIPYSCKFYSSDFPGAITRKLEQDSGDYVALMFQGGVGDTRISMDHSLYSRDGSDLDRALAKIDVVGKIVSDKIKGLRETAVISDVLYIDHASPEITIPLVNVQAIPDILLPLEIIGRFWIESCYMPIDANIDLTHFDNGKQGVFIVNMPFELTSTLSIKLRHDLESAKEKAYDTATITSLANGWHSYLLHEDGFDIIPNGPEQIENFLDAGYAEHSLFPYVLKAARSFPKSGLRSR